MNSSWNGWLIILHLFFFTSSAIADADDPWCAEGVRNDQVCCSKSCGVCGTSKCADLPGGAGGCCTGVIRKRNGPCQTHSDVACTLPADVVAAARAKSASSQALAFAAATAAASAEASAAKTFTPSTASSRVSASRRTSRSSPAHCTLNDLGAVLRDIKSEYSDSPVALNRIRAALGHLPDAYELAVKNGGDFIWGKRQVWAPDNCGNYEEPSKPSGCNVS